MDNPTTLLVAIMYVTIISIGLSNLLTTLSELTRPGSAMPAKVHMSWLLLMLLAYFSYFWQTTEILKVENWEFAGFIGVLVGPVLLLFAVNLLVVLPDNDNQDPEQHYLGISGRFFTLLGMFQIWLALLDVVVGEISLQTGLAAGLAALCFVMALSASQTFHHRATVLCGAIYIVTTAANVL